MKNQWRVRVIVGFILVLLVVVLAVLNNQIVPLNFGIAKIKGPLILIILGSAILGALIGLLTSTTTMWHQKKDMKALLKELDQYKHQIETLVQKEREKVTRSYETQLAELQAKYDQLAGTTQTSTLDSTTETTRIDRYTKPRETE